jgi:hypothetical protein
VFDSRCINNMIDERMMFTSFEKNECENDCITFINNSQESLVLVKLLSQPNIQFLKFFLLNL